MNVFGRLLAVLSLGLLWSCGDGAHPAGPKGIGEVDVVVRVVRGTLVSYDEARLLAVKDPVYWRERIETENDSATQMEFADGTRLSVGPDARVILDEFVYGGPAGTDRMVLTVTKGISRFITGDMDKTAYEIRAPGAIIGVRGTEFTLFVDPDQGTTTCLVHHGEVTFRRSDGGAPVIIKPGEASKVVAGEPTGITAPAPPAPEVIREADRLQSVIREARNVREEERLTREAAVSRPEPGDRRLAAFQSSGDGRDRLSVLVDQVRGAAGSGNSGSGNSGSGNSGSGNSGSGNAGSGQAVGGSAVGNVQVPAPASVPSVSALGSASVPATTTTSIGGVPLPPAKGLCSEGASCLAEPPPNRIISPTHL